MSPSNTSFANLKNTGSLLRTALLLTGVLVLSACGSSGGGGGGGATPLTEDPGSQSIGGGGVKGPLADAIVTVYSLDTSAADFKGAVAGSGTTDTQARIQNLSLPFLPVRRAP